MVFPRISCQQDVMLVTFPEADQGAGSWPLFHRLFRRRREYGYDQLKHPERCEGGSELTTSYENWALVMQTLPRLTGRKKRPCPLIGGGYSKLNLFGQEMEGMCGVAARVLAVWPGQGRCGLITTIRWTSAFGGCRG